MLHAEAAPNSFSPQALAQHFTTDVMGYVQQPGHLTEGALAPLHCIRPSALHGVAEAFRSAMRSSGKHPDIIHSHSSSAGLRSLPRRRPVLADRHLALVLQPRGPVGGPDLAHVHRHVLARRQHSGLAVHLCAVAARLCAPRTAPACCCFDRSSSWPAMRSIHRHLIVIMLAMFLCSGSDASGAGAGQQPKLCVVRAGLRRAQPCHRAAPPLQHRLSGERIFDGACVPMSSLGASSRCT